MDEVLHEVARRKGRRPKRQEKVYKGVAAFGSSPTPSHHPAEIKAD